MLRPSTSVTLNFQALEHKPEAVEAWVGELCQRFGDGPIAVAVEQVKGALVYMLRKYECLHLYPVPSTMSASMRGALYPSGAKDDPRDADLLLELLVLHRDKLRRLTPDNEATRRVQNLVEERRKLVEEKTAQLNRLTGYLKVYFPQMLEWLSGRLLQLLFRGLLSVYSRYGLHARRVAMRPSTPKAPTVSLPPLPLRLLPGGANQFPGGSCTRRSPAPFHGALFQQLRA
jgi:hypothetical protein